jgi:hypothetical protein
VEETRELETSMVVDAAGLLDVELRVDDTGAVKMRVLTGLLVVERRVEEIRVLETGTLTTSVLVDATGLLKVGLLVKTKCVLVEIVGLLETSLVIETVGLLDTCALLEALGLTDVDLLVVGLGLIGEAVVS